MDIIPPQSPQPEISPVALKNQTLTLPVAILLAGILIAGAVVYTRGGPRQAALGSGQTAVANANYGPQNMKPVDAHDHILGNPNAPVKIVEYSDLECPYCKDFQNVLHETLDAYGKDGKVAWVYRNFPLTKHPKGTVEANAAECIASAYGETAFWNYIDKIFEVTQSNNTLDLALLPQIAQDQIKSFDLASFTTCQNAEKFKDQITASVQDGIRSGITGTPTSFVISGNGKVYPIAGWVNADAMKQIVQLAIDNKL